MSEFSSGVVVLGVLTGVLLGTTLWFYRRAAMRATGESTGAAEEGQERFQALFHSSTCGTIEIGPDGIIRLFNPAAEKVFGYKCDEVVGKNVSMLMPGPNRSSHDQFLRSYLDTREAKVIGIGRDVVGLRKNGEEFPAHLDVGEFTISGRTSFVGTIIDVSDQVWATRRAQESQRHLELLANANPSLVSHVGADLRYLYVNRAYADWYGKSTHEIIGKTVRELHGDDEYQRLRPHIEAVLSGKEIEFSVDLDAVGTDERSIHVRLVPDVQGDEAVAGYFVFTSEITERVRLEAQLRQSQNMEAVGQLTGGVAHDFNNLLAIIQGNLSLLMHDLDQGRELRAEDLRESIAAALQASERGAELTHRLLAFSRRQPL